MSGLVLADVTIFLVIFAIKHKVKAIFIALKIKFSLNFPSFKLWS